VTRVLPSAVLSFFTLLGLSGCGGDPMNAASVKGKVTVDSQPLTKGSVRFVPDKAKGNTSPVEPIGLINESGQYELSTNGKPGAPLGWYKVAVIAADTPDSSKATAVPKSYVAKKFNDPEASGLTVEVVSSAKDGAYDLKVTAK
jgi:hypothetical protein